MLCYTAVVICPPKSVNRHYYIIFYVYSNVEATCTLQDTCLFTQMQKQFFYPILKLQSRPQSTTSSEIEKIKKIDCMVKKIQNLSKNIVLQWIPAHCVLNGNEKADMLAKITTKST